MIRILIIEDAKSKFVSGNAAEEPIEDDYDEEIQILGVISKYGTKREDKALGSECRPFLGFGPLDSPYTSWLTLITCLGALARRGLRADPLLPKPDRTGSSPAGTENTTGRSRFCVVRGCPLVTGHDCCEWHARGTAGQNETLARRGDGYQLAKGEARPR
jgi:hypothetical protein